MSFIAINEIVSARRRLEKKLTKGETFAGLILYLSNISNRINPQYTIADMRQFSLDADKAFYLNDEINEYSQKQWYALFSPNWIDLTKNAYLNNQKISAMDFSISLYWRDSFSNANQIIDKLKKSIGADVFLEFFDDDSDREIKLSNVKVSGEELFLMLGGDASSDNKTIKFDGKFIQKKAGELSSAPFAQTLYAANEIKKIVTIVEFDFIRNFNLRIIHGEQFSIHQSFDYHSLAKPFILLAGVSGSGKTRFVREQAKRTGSLSETYQLIPVRPDWHEPANLIGYVSRLNGSPEYVATDFLRFIVKAWLRIKPEIVIDAETNQIIWQVHSIDDIPPYWLCLDEMNLAPVEQYFADYLSILETREWRNNQQAVFQYCCDPLLKAELLQDLCSYESDTFQVSPEATKLAKSLGLNLTEDDHRALFNIFYKHGVPLPFNLIVAGTVNMDETTHSFSRKVIDRALSIDFIDFFPNNFDEFFKENATPVTFFYSTSTHANTIDFEVGFVKEAKDRSIAFLTRVNTILENTPFKLAYRALNELLLAIANTDFSDDNTNDVKLESVWDDFIMMKILPRIEGDQDKLNCITNNTDNQTNVLAELELILKFELKKIWSDDHNRIDLYRTKKKINNEDQNHTTINIQCRSKRKLQWMLQRLNNTGFSHFWT